MGPAAPREKTGDGYSQNDCCNQVSVLSDAGFLARQGLVKSIRNKSELMHLDVNSEKKGRMRQGGSKHWAAFLQTGLVEV